MDVFIIGGTGFISGAMTRMLLAEGHHVTIFTRGRQGLHVDGTERLEHVHGDRNSLASLRTALRGRTFDAAYDMIAYDGDDSRVAVEALRGHVGRLIHCSTISVYMISGEVRCPVTEDQDDKPVMSHWARNPFGMDYGIKKRECEKTLWKAHGSDLPVTILRPTFVSGPEDRTARDYFWIERILDGGPLLVPGSGDHAYQQLYVDDAARAFVDVLNYDATLGEAYNLAAEEIYSLNEYLALVAGILERSIEIVHVDQDTFDRLPLSSDPRGDVFPFNTRRTAVFSLDKIKRDIGYRSTSFDTWMRKTIRWYRHEFAGHSTGYNRRSEEIELIDGMRRSSR